MSLMGSALGGALAGAGAGAAQIANSYIDAEIQQEKARALADIQYANSVKLDQYNLSKPRQDALTAAEAARERAVGAARNETTLAGKVAEAGNKDLRQAKIDDANEFAKGTQQTRIDVENAIVTGTASAKIKAEADRAAALLPLEIRRAYALADAAAKASASRREAPGAELTAKLAIVEKTLDRPLTEQEKLGLFGLSKSVETDKVTTTEETIDPETGSTKTRKVESVVPRGGPPPKLTQEQAYAYARDAIARKANPAEVDKMLVGMGFAPLSGAGAAENASTTPVGGRPLMDAAAEGGAGTKTRQDALAERQLRIAADYADRQRQSGEMEQQAQAAYAKIAPGDRRAASRMRDDPLFEYLTAQQKASVMRTLSGM